MSTTKKIKIVAKGKKVEIFLYGEIESADQAELLGLELKMYESQFDTCVVRLNTVGGAVPEGFAMWSLLRSTTMNIEFIVDGIAASMGGALLQLPGAKRKMAKYSKLMLHRICGGAIGTPEEMRAAADMAEQWENDIVNAISERTGKSTDEVRAKWFDGKDHWLSAQQALEEGLIDEIVDGNSTIALPETVRNAQEAYTYFNNLLNPDKMEFKNKAEFVKALGLSNTATDEAILDAALKAVKDKANLKNQVSTLTTERDGYKAKVEAAELKEKEEREDQIKNILDKAIEGKKLTAEMREHYENLFEKDFESTKLIVTNLPSVQNLSTLTKGDGGEDRRGWSFKDWQKKDSKGLAAMKRDNVEAYKSLFKSQYGRDPELK
jgi:ATP-dependent protease ClpP protease subunit